METKEKPSARRTPCQCRLWLRPGVLDIWSPPQAALRARREASGLKAPRSAAPREAMPRRFPAILRRLVPSPGWMSVARPRKAHKAVHRRRPTGMFKVLPFRTRSRLRYLSRQNLQEAHNWPYTSASRPPVSARLTFQSSPSRFGSITRLTASNLNGRVTFALAISPVGSVVTILSFVSTDPEAAHGHQRRAMGARVFDRTRRRTAAEPR